MGALALGVWELPTGAGTQGPIFTTDKTPSCNVHSRYLKAERAESCALPRKFLILPKGNPVAVARVVPGLACRWHWSARMECLGEKPRQ
jgi:hypothetical protein